VMQHCLVYDCGNLHLSCITDLFARIIVCSYDCLGFGHKLAEVSAQ